MGPRRHVPGMLDPVADRTAEAAPVASLPGSSREWEGGGTRAEKKGADEMGRRLEKGTLFQSSPSVSPSIFRGYKRKREERTLFRCRSSRLQDSRACPTGLAQSLHSELFMSSWVPLRIPSWKPKSGPQYVSKFTAPGGNDQIFHKGNNIKPIKVPSVRDILGDVVMESVLLMKQAKLTKRRWIIFQGYNNYRRPVT